MKTVITLIMLLLPDVARAQPDARMRAKTTDEFLARARAAAAAFVDREAALMDGYRPIGGELPAMGQHWLNPEYANAGYVDPDKPAFLLYVTINGKPQLGGIGYTIALQPGEQLPSIPARSAWHEHAGSVADEMYALLHHSQDDERRFRVVALHIWHHLKAPDGLFTAENWNVPFYRNELPPPTPMNYDAARQLALTHGADLHYAEMLRRHGLLSDATQRAVREILTKYADKAREWVTMARDGGADITQLERAYHAMWTEMLAQARSAERKALSDVKNAWASVQHKH